MAGRGRREVGDRLSGGTGAAGEGGAQPAALLRAGSQLPWPGAGPHRSCRVTASVPAEPRGPEAGRGHEKGRARSKALGAPAPARPRAPRGRGTRPGPEAGGLRLVVGLRRPRQWGSGGEGGQR